MTLHPLPVLLGLLAAHLFAATAHAAPDILPGLWETKVDVSSKSGQFEQAMEQAQQMLANLPPEQQEMMKEMMASRGVFFDLANRTMQTCLTQAAIDRFDVAQTAEGCTQRLDEKDQNHFVMTMKCDDKGMSGEGEFVVNSDKSYTGTMVMNVDMNGQPDALTMNQEGRWLSSDCGDIQPD